MLIPTLPCSRCGPPTKTRARHVRDNDVTRRWRNGARAVYRDSADFIYLDKDNHLRTCPTDRTSALCQRRLLLPMKQTFFSFLHPLPYILLFSPPLFRSSPPLADYAFPLCHISPFTPCPTEGPSFPSSISPFPPWPTRVPSFPSPKD